MPRPGDGALRAQLKTDIDESITKIASPVLHLTTVLDVVDHIMVLVDAYTASVRDDAHRGSRGLK